MGGSQGGAESGEKMFLRETEPRILEEKILKLETQLQKAKQQASMVKIERDAWQSLYSQLKKRAAEEEERATTEINAITRELNLERAEVAEEIQGMQADIRDKDREITLLQEFRDESKEQMDFLEHRIAILESGEGMASLSQKLSSMLSTIGQVILVRPSGRQSVHEKTRDLTEGIGDLVREIRRRREYACDAAQRICHLENERLLWMLESTLIADN